MKRKYNLLYAVVGLGGVGMSLDQASSLVNSTSLEATFKAFVTIAWGLWVASHVGYYWLFMRQYGYENAAPNQQPTLGQFNAWLSPSQQRVLTGLQVSLVGSGGLWLLSKWFF
ncbi:hypothetical protein [Herpetosiphon sp. NSE202]|uniref:hypothetical protein n=1 Tax=Herpetosiphon sp. NSE202 TaxID=3351349 RepID=UPI00362975E6